MEITGALKLKMDEQTFDSGFKKREFVLTTSKEQYPQDIKFELLKDKCELIESVSEGQKLTVAFNIRGNEYNGKYYNNLVAWNIKAEGGQAKPRPVEAAINLDADGDEDDLPF